MEASPLKGTYKVGPGSTTISLTRFGFTADPDVTGDNTRLNSILWLL